MKLEDIKSPLPPRVPLGNEGKVSGGVVSSKRQEIPGEEKEEVSREKEGKERGRNMKKVLGGVVVVVGVVIVAVVAILLSRSMKSGGGIGKEVVINYWGMWEEASVMEGVIADFESKNPKIKVRYTKSFFENYRSRLAGRLQKDPTQIEVPDVFRIHSSWLPMFTNNLAPVSKSIVKNIGLEEDFFEIYSKDLKRDGAYQAIPLMYDGLALFYNKKLIEAAGVKLPKTWWGLETAAGKLTVRDDQTGRIKVAGVAMGMAENVDHWSDIVGLMMKQNGVDLLKNDPENDKKLENVLTFYTLFATKTKAWDGSLPNSTEMFARGNLAFYFGPSWRAYNIDDMNPELEYGIMMVPQLPTLDNVPLDQIESELGSENITNIHWASYWVEGVNIGSENKEAAFKFLEYLASKEGLERMYETASQLRAFGEIPPRKSMAESVAKNKKVKPFVEAAPFASSGWMNSRTFDEGLNDEMNKYFKDAINAVVLGNSSVTGVISNLTNGINQLVNKYQLNY